MTSVNILVKTLSFYLELFHRYGVLKLHFLPTLHRWSTTFSSAYRLMILFEKMSNYIYLRCSWCLLIQYDASWFIYYWELCDSIASSCWQIATHENIFIVADEIFEVIERASGIDEWRVLSSQTTVNIRSLIGHFHLLFNHDLDYRQSHGFDARWCWLHSESCSVWWFWICKVSL